MQKLKTFFMRLAGGSFKRMFRNAEKAASDSGRSKLAVLFDMAYCILRLGVGYLDYLVFGFQFVRGEARKTFMTYDDNLRLTKKLNDRAACDVYENKLNFCREFGEFLGRETIDISANSQAAFAEFIKGKSDLFAKNPGGFGGLSVKHVAVSKDADASALYDELKAANLFDVEDAIKQCAEMNELCPDSVNTVRIVTVLKDDGEAVPMYALVRMGFGGTRVDNISSGGMYCPVDLGSGEIYAKAFCDKTGDYYETHPATGTKLVGFVIPRFDEAISLVKKAAARTPKVRYVGWDVAISENGPVLVEGNTLPGYDMCQNYYHQKVKGLGRLPEFRTVAGEF